jgi:hypothetical protein
VIRLERFDLKRDPDPSESSKLIQDEVSALFHGTAIRSDSYFEAGIWPTTDSAGPDDLPAQVARFGRMWRALTGTGTC